VDVGRLPWLEGEPADPDALADPVAAAEDLAGFLAALHRFDTTGGVPGRSRGIPLKTRDEDVRTALEQLAGEADVGAARAVWEDALRAPEWQDEPRWLHGDLWPANVLAREGRL
jgi:aminoglycoside phosphotransferase (APT) family kinase protein